MYSDKVLKFIIITFVLLITLKFSITSDFFDTPQYVGRGFTIIRPEGWITAKKNKIMDMGVFMMAAEKPEKVIFETAEINPDNDAPQAYIAVYAAQLFAPAWIEDFHSEIVSSLKKNDYKILDEGEIKIDGQVSNWFLLKGGDTPGYKIEFYFCDDRKGFYKIRYSAQKGMFDKYRSDFERCRSTFKFTFALV